MQSLNQYCLILNILAISDNNNVHFDDRTSTDLISQDNFNSLNNLSFNNANNSESDGFRDFNNKANTATNSANSSNAFSLKDEYYLIPIINAESDNLYLELIKELIKIDDVCLCRLSNDSVVNVFKQDCVNIPPTSIDRIADLNKQIHRRFFLEKDSSNIDNVSAIRKEFEDKFKNEFKDEFSNEPIDDRAFREAKKKRELVDKIVDSYGNGIRLTESLLNVNYLSDFLLMRKNQIKESEIVINPVIWELIKLDFFTFIDAIVDLSTDDDIRLNSTIRVKLSSPKLNLKEKATNSETCDHIFEVIKGLLIASNEIGKRIILHDRSKLQRGEVETFAEYTPKLKELEYGSDEYKLTLQKMNKALEHHYRYNRHHPEHFNAGRINPSENILIEELIKDFKERKAKGQISQSNENALDYLIKLLELRKSEITSSINNMNLIDLLEMLIDWNAATKRHETGNIYKSIEINKTRFSINEQLINVFLNTVQNLLIE